MLVSDDLAMQALQGSPAERARAALAAGCDIALHCSGMIADTRNLLEALDETPTLTIDRLAAARDKARASRRDLDGAALADERAKLLAA